MTGVTHAKPSSQFAGRGEPLVGLQADPGRYSELTDTPEVRELEQGMDFRLPQYRREVFLRFYEFHLRYRAHPGAVYYVLPYLASLYEWDRETSLWFAWLNGNTQNPVTSWLLWQEAPTVSDAGRLPEFFEREAKRLAFDTDRRHQKYGFLAALKDYQQQLSGRSQSEFWEECGADFARFWQKASGLLGFGRLSTFSFLEYLSIVGLPVECDRLFLEDMSGSKSHRNGLAKVLGRDDLDWHDSNPTFTGKYSATMLSWLNYEGEVLLTEARERLANESFAPSVNYFTLESALCTYKSWYRPNRRYPNVYNDMFYLRIMAGEKAWGQPLDPFWQARSTLPEYLRLEDNPDDPGLVPAKQNYFRETGCPPMMERDWECFDNDGAWRLRQ